ncbi:MAG: hypothetical protein HQL56_15470, partial [Magnetococcales bacterium]|nr:hypothetical protein [Magnetococcales bacterium]
EPETRESFLFGDNGFAAKLGREMRDWRPLAASGTGLGRDYAMSYAEGGSGSGIGGNNREIVLAGNMAKTKPLTIPVQSAPNQELHKGLRENRFKKDSAQFEPMMDALKDIEPSEQAGEEIRNDNRRKLEPATTPKGENESDSK